MQLKRFFPALFAGLMLVMPVGCGGKTEADQFKSGLEESIKAAEKGKDLVKSPHSGKRTPKNR